MFNISYKINSYSSYTLVKLLQNDHNARFLDGTQSQKLQGVVSIAIILGSLEYFTEYLDMQ